jgi:hypothetical protein
VRHLFTEHHLRQSGCVAQVNEGDTAVIAPASHPPSKGDGRASVGSTEIPGKMGAKHVKGLS